MKIKNGFMEYRNLIGSAITDKISIYNCDCMELLKQTPDNYYSLALVDPPYGGNDAIGLKNNTNNKKQSTKRTDYHVFENKHPSLEYFTELKRVSKKQIIWGVNFYPYEEIFTGGRLCWDKKGTAFGRAELAYLSFTKSVEICEIVWNGMLQQDMKNKENRIHPTQKPVALYKWLLDKYAKEGDKILDTHLGSMSIAIACADYGFELVGCELDPDYYKKGIERIQNHISQTKLEF